jgi:hypothetical protein
MRVEFMIRDSKKYASTLGWGWARWIGTGLVPWGTDAASVAPSCVNCHKPLEKENYVFTLPFADSLRVGKIVGSLPDSLGFPLRGKVVTVFADAPKGTVSTLYSSSPVVAAGAYPAGTVLSLVTWDRQDDARWFGGEIPGALRSVEQVVIGVDGKSAYADWSGPGLQHNNVDNEDIVRRVAVMLHKRAAVMP